MIMSANTICLSFIPIWFVVASPVSMRDEIDRLISLAQEKTVIRHYLEPSMKAPRTFSATQDNDSTWLECLMRVSHVGTAFPVLGGMSSGKLCERLWGNIGTSFHRFTFTMFKARRMTFLIILIFSSRPETERMCCCC